MEVVKSTDSIDLVSCSTVAVVVSDVALFCLLLSRIFGDTLFIPYSTTHGRFDYLGLCTF